MDEEKEEKTLSLSEVFKYCIRRWLIILIAAVVGSAGFLVQSLVQKNMQGRSFSATMAVPSLSNYYNLGTQDLNESIVQAYSNSVRRALDTMMTDELKVTTFRAVGNALYTNTKLLPAEQEKDFRSSLVITAFSYYVKIQFKYSKDNRATDEKCKMVVQEYMKLAEEAAVRDDSLLYNKIHKTDVYEELRDSFVERTNVLKNILLGLCAGLALGVGITVVLYFADGRIKSQDDIRVGTGRLLGVDTGGGVKTFAPKVYTALTESGARSVLFTAPKRAADSTAATELARYAAQLGRSCLYIDLTEQEGMPLSDVLSGERPLVPQKGAVTSVAGQENWKCIPAYADAFASLTAKFDLTLLYAPFSGDGSLAPLGAVVDAYITALKQTETTVKELFAAVNEIDAPEKAAGCILLKPGKSFVGKIV